MHLPFPYVLLPSQVLLFLSMKVQNAKQSSSNSIYSTVFPKEFSPYPNFSLLKSNLKCVVSYILLYSFPIFFYFLYYIFYSFLYFLWYSSLSIIAIYPITKMSSRQRSMSYYFFNISIVFK